MVSRFISSLELKLSSQRQRSYRKYGLSRSLSWEGEDKNRDPGFYGIIFWLFHPRTPTGIREGKDMPGDIRRSSLLGATLNFLGDLALIWKDQLLILSESFKSFCCLSPPLPPPTGYVQPSLQVHASAGFQTCCSALWMSMPCPQGTAGLARQSPALPRREMSIRCFRRFWNASAITRTPSYVRADVY